MLRQEGPVELSISPDKVVFLIEKAKQFEAENDENEASQDPASEFFGFINSLNVDEQTDLVALMWLGRDNYTAADWQQLRAEATAARSDHTDSYLSGTPLLSDFLEAGLEALNYPVAELESKAF